MKIERLLFRMKNRGCFILFEGLDRSGKSTQAKLLCDTLADKYKFKTELAKYPNRDTPTGKQINDYLTKKIELHDREIHKLFSQNRWESIDSLKKKLASGVHLIRCCLLSF
jgi:dTMP kinase